MEEQEVNKGALNAKIWKLFLDRKLYTIFADETGFVHRPTVPQIPT